MRLLLPAIFFSQLLFAQTPVEIRKHRIASIISYTVYDSGSDTIVSETFYDQQGYDTAIYRSGSVYRRMEMQYDEKNRPLRCEVMNAEGKKEESHYFEFEADGSYKVTTTDMQFFMKSYEWFDKEGKLLKYESPDGTQGLYSFDEKGRKKSFRTIPRNDGIKQAATYTYDTKGRVQKEIFTGDYPFTRELTWLDNGLPAGSITLSGDAGDVMRTEVRYLYRYLP